MNHELERLRNEKDEAFSRLNGVLKESNVENHLLQVKGEHDRVIRLSGQAGVVLDKIDSDFKEKTRLSNTDTIILFLCTAIQCARQYLLRNDAFRMEAKDGDALTKAPVKKVLSWVEKRTDNPVAKDKITYYKEFLTSPVPYDSVKHSPGLITGISGATHRYRTAAHDPVLGWIFGPVNILSSSLTRSDIITTFLVQDDVMVAPYPLGTPGAVLNAISVVKSNPEMLPLALMKQMIHFGSDFFTKQSLPLPLLGTLSPETAHKLMFTRFNNCPQIDSFSVSRQAAIAALINQLVYYIHQLFYQGEKDGTPEQYEVRSRKILSYSNLLASGSNIIVTAVSEDLSKLDVGGILVTLYRLISDYKFIHDVKCEFLQKEFYKQVVGETYDFMRGYSNV